MLSQIFYEETYYMPHISFECKKWVILWTNFYHFCVTPIILTNFLKHLAFFLSSPSPSSQFFILWNLLFFLFFSFFKKKLSFQFFCLSDRFLSSSQKLVSATVFLPKIFSPAAGWLIYELHLGFLFHSKNCLKDTTK